TSSGLAALALMAAITLSAFCRCLSSSRTTSLVPATGAHPPAPAALGGAEVPDDPALPQPARPTAATSPTSATGTRVALFICSPPSVSRRGGRAACPTGGHKVRDRPGASQTARRGGRQPQRQSVTRSPPPHRPGADPACGAAAAESRGT